MKELRDRACGPRKVFHQGLPLESDSAVLVELQGANVFGEKGRIQVQPGIMKSLETKRRATTTQCLGLL